MKEFGTRVDDLLRTNELTLARLPKLRDDLTEPWEARFPKVGFAVSVFNLNLSHEGLIASLKIPERTSIGLLNFTPTSANKFKRSEVLYCGMRGLNLFFSVLDDVQLYNSNFLFPKYLCGVTNDRMARFSKHLGFLVEKNQFGSYAVRAPTHTVRTLLNHIQEHETYGSSFESRLELRVKRICHDI